MSGLAAILPYFQVVTAIVLVVAILLQSSGEGAGSAFGGSGSASFYTKRGWEKKLFIATIVIAVLFVAGGILNLLLR